MGATGLTETITLALPTGNAQSTGLQLFGDLTMQKLAREIAADILPLERILEVHGVTSQQWETIRHNPHFNRLLASEIEAWHSASNTAERVKVKTQAMIEEWLPEAFARLNAPSENLNHKVELAKLIRDLAGMGGRNVDATGGGERVSISINLGSGDPIRIEKAPMIEGEVIRE